MPAPLHEKNLEPRKIRVGAEHQNVRRGRRLVVPFVAVMRKEFFFGKPVLVFKFFQNRKNPQLVRLKRTKSPQARFFSLRQTAPVARTNGIPLVQLTQLH